MPQQPIKLRQTSLAPVFKYKLSTTTRTSTTTATDDPELAGFVLQPNTVYMITGVLFFGSDDGTTGFKWSFNKNGGTNDGDVLSFMKAEGSAVGDVRAINAAGLTSIRNETISSSGTRTGIINGYIKTVDEITLDLEWAQVSSVATNTRLLIGSWIRFEVAGT